MISSKLPACGIEVTSSSHESTQESTQVEKQGLSLSFRGQLAEFGTDLSSFRRTHVSRWFLSMPSVVSKRFCTKEHVSLYQFICRVYARLL